MIWNYSGKLYSPYKSFLIKTNFQLKNNKQMKKNLTILKTVFLFLFTVFLLQGCRTENLSEEHNHYVTKTLYDIQNVPQFSSFISRTKNKKINSNKSFKSVNDNSKVLVIEKPDITSYSTLIYHEDLSFEILVYSINKNGKESFYKIKYLPEDKFANNKIENFTGKVEFSNDSDEIFQTVYFNNGVVDTNKKSRSSRTSYCHYSITVTAVNCTAGGGHSPGEACRGTADQQPYYDVYVSSYCNQEQEAGDFNGGSASYGEVGDYGGGGGGFDVLGLIRSKTDDYHWNLFNQLDSDNVAKISELVIYNTFEDGMYNFIISFFSQNPNTTIEQFQNWFMGQSEGQDGEYDLASEIAFQQQQFQKHSLPSMADYEKAFPSKPNAIYPDYYRDAVPNYEVYNNYVGGRLKQLFNLNGGAQNTANPYYNTCAVRQSYAHNKLGIMIPFQNNDSKGDNNWNYILTASKMGVFLEGTYGPPTYKLVGTDANDLKKIGEFLKGKTGIYLVINNDREKAVYTGHTDMIKNGWVSGGANVTYPNGKIINGGLKYIYIWELK